MTRDELIYQIKKKGSFLCVGLDSDIRKIPNHLRSDPNPILAFNKAIIDATKDFAVAYKPNLAFYEAQGEAGWATLRETLNYIPKDCFTIADAKRGDIGNTARMYAETFFHQYDFDSVTIAPYMGHDSVQPFLEYPGKWGIVLGLTSNAGAIDFQFQLLQDGGKKLYQKVLETVKTWGDDTNTMFVIGATKADMLKQVRAIIPNHFLLVPGVGAQGGSLADVAKNGMNSDCGLLVNMSRGIIYVDGSEGFEVAVAEKAASVQQEMKSLLKEANIL